MHSHRFSRQLAVLATLCAVAGALAGPELVSGPDPDDRGGWSLTWRLYNHGHFNQLQFLIVEGQFATAPGIDGFAPPSWSQTYNDGRLLVAEGPRLDDLY